MRHGCRTAPGKENKEGGEQHELKHEEQGGGKEAKENKSKKVREQAQTNTEPNLGGRFQRITAVRLLRLAEARTDIPKPQDTQTSGR